MDSLQEQIIGLTDKSQETVMQLNKKIRKIRQNSRKQSPKRIKDEFEWWSNNIVNEQGRFDKLLISPQFNRKNMQQLGLGCIEWKVVNPLLFRLISQHYSNFEADYDKPSNLLQGLTIFISGLRSALNEHSYFIGQQYAVEMYLFGVEHQSYCFIGFLENNVNFGELLKFMHEGMCSLYGEEVVCCKNRKGFIKLNSILFTQNQLKEEHQREFNCQNFDVIASNKPQINKQVIVILQYSSCKTENLSETQGIMGHKKIKKNEILEGFHKPITPDIYRTTYDKKLVKFREFMQNHPQIIKQHLQPQQKSSTTEGDTPDHLETFFHQNTVQAQQQRIRINHPLWSECNNLQAFRKLAELKMNVYIPRPFQQDQQWHFRDRQGGRLLIDRCCNRLQTNTQMEVEEIIDTHMEIEQDIPIQAQEGLQKIAKSIMGERQTEKGSTKQKSQFESLTCKYQGDDLDSQLSRQC